MITDFPEAKQLIGKALRLDLEKKIEQSAPLLSAIGHITVREGDRLGIIYEDGHHVVNDFQEAGSSFSVARDEVSKVKPETLVANMNNVAKDMAEQMEGHILQTLNETIAQSGNAVYESSTSGFEFVLGALERLPINFKDDDRLKPVPPTFVLHPTQGVKLQQCFANASQEKMREFEGKLAAVLDRKFQEHLADLDSRRLVD